MEPPDPRFEKATSLEVRASECDDKAAAAKREAETWTREAETCRQEASALRGQLAREAYDIQKAKEQAARGAAADAAFAGTGSRTSRSSQEEPVVKAKGKPFLVGKARSCGTSDAVQGCRRTCRTRRSSASES